MKQNYEGQLRALQNQLVAEQNANQALRFAASQGAQTAQILANNEAQLPRWSSIWLLLPGLPMWCRILTAALRTSGATAMPLNADQSSF